jgi:glycosyltransferase involved in cell wall biosynthesis
MKNGTKRSFLPLSGMEKRLRVFFIPRWFPLPEDPLWGSFVLNHAKALQSRADVFVLYTDAATDQKLAGKPLFTEVDGIPTLYLRYHKCSAKWIGGTVNAIRMLLCWHRAWRLAVKTWEKPHINHVHILTRMGVFALIVKWIYGIPYVITEHWSRYLPENMYFKGYLRKLVTLLVVRRAGAMMPVSHHLQMAMEGFGLYHKNHVVVPNVVDTDLFCPDSYKNGNKPYTFIHISTFDERAKNTFGLIRVVARLAEHHAGFELRMIGDGEGRGASEALAHDLLPNNQIVHFEGAKKPAEVAEALAQADMLVQFSNYENLPVVILEAFACGVPVIATRVGGIPEIVNASNGILVNPGNEEELFRVMSEMLTSGSQRFRTEEIRRFAIEKFSPEVVVSIILKVYQQTLKTVQHD